VHQKLLKQLRKRAYHDPDSLTAFDGGDLSGGTQHVVTEGDIIGTQKKAKQDYEERMASIQAGREGREKFGSHKARGRKGLKNGATGSSTNEAKSRQKAFAMTQNSNKVSPPPPIHLAFDVHLLFWFYSDMSLLFRCAAKKARR
jgi:protein SDA1